MNSRVNHLAIHEHLPHGDADAVAAIRTQIERVFLNRVLESLEGAVHARFGEQAIVCVQRVRARWQLSLEELGKPEIAAELGEGLAADLIASFDRMAPREVLRPRADQEVFVFFDSAHASAAHLVAHLDGERDTWPFASFPLKGDPWPAACQRGPAHLAAVLEWLVRMKMEKPVLSALGGAAIARAVAVLPANRWPAPLRSMADDGAGSGDRESRAGSISGRGVANSSDLRGVTTGDSDPSAELPDRSHDSVPAAVARETTPPPETRGAAEADDSPATSLDGSEFTVTTSEHAVTSRVAGQTATVLPADTTSDALVATDFAGLFYVVGRILELELGEHLWCAGIREDHLLCQVGRVLLGRDGLNDPAPGWLGGIFPPDGPSLTPVEAWVFDEVTQKLEAALADRLQRRHLPPADRETSESLRASYATRICESLPRSPHPMTAKLLARVCEALCTLFCARLDRTPDAGIMTAALAVPGHLERTSDELRVRMPMSAINIDIRRAGLDSDPGYAPWLRRTVRIIFDDEAAG